jgi:hypothetical protein
MSILRYSPDTQCSPAKRVFLMGEAPLYGHSPIRSAHSALTCRGFRLQGFGFWGVKFLGFGVRGLGFWGFWGFGVQDVGYRVWRACVGDQYSPVEASGFRVVVVE